MLKILFADDYLATVDKLFNQPGVALGAQRAAAGGSKIIGVGRKR